MKKYIVGVVVGIITTLIFLYASGALAQIKVQTNPLFDPIDPTTGEKLPKDAKAPKTYTQAENDFTMVYGRLDFIVKQLNELQNTCAKQR